MDKLKNTNYEISSCSMVFKEDPSLGRNLILLKAMIRTLSKEGKSSLVECNHLEGKRMENAYDCQLLESTPSFLTLQQFVDVFNMPLGLPPSEGMSMLFT